MRPPLLTASALVSEAMDGTSKSTARARAAWRPAAPQGPPFDSVVVASKTEYVSFEAFPDSIILGQSTQLTVIANGGSGVLGNVYGSLRQVARTQGIQPFHVRLRPTGTRVPQIEICLLDGRR
jgi:hypothetical protein